MNRYIIIDSEGLITNAVLWDGEAEWTPEDGHTTVLNDEAPYYDIGGTLIDDVYTPPAYPVRHIILQDSDGLIINAVMWDGVEPYALDAGTSIILNDEEPFYFIGGTLVGNVYTPPVGE